MKTTALKESASPRTLGADPARQSFLLLRTVFTVAPVLFGLDKFTNLLTDWTGYLAPIVPDTLHLPGRR